MSQHYSIGQVAKQVDLSVEAIRYYEKQGLIPEPVRTASGYRQYKQDTIDRLNFIQQAKAVGFSLSEINELLNLRAREDSTCASVRAHAERKIADIDQKISELERMKNALQRLASNCPGKGPISDCPIIDEFETVK